jgi:hypothetical protein
MTYFWSPNASIGFLLMAARNSSSPFGGDGVQLYSFYSTEFFGLARSGLVALRERMNPFHSPPEPSDEGSPLSLLSASFSACSSSSSTTGLQPACMPKPTPLRLSSAEDRFRSGVSAGLLGESAEVARGTPGLLEEISPGPPSAGGTKSPTTTRARPKTAAGESCKQQLGYLPSADFSIT